LVRELRSDQINNSGGRITARTNECGALLTSRLKAQKMTTLNIGKRLLFLVTLLVGSRLYGGLISPQSPLALESKADLIVVAVGSSVSQQGDTMPVSLQVLRVIKGDAALAGTSISALWTNGPTTVGGGSQLGGIWFLFKSGQTWGVIPVVQGAIDLSMTYYPSPSSPILSAYAYDPNTSVQDKFAAELGSGIEATGSSALQYNFLFESGLLDSLQSAVISLLYERLAGSIDTRKRLLGLGGLIRQGDIAALESAAQTASTDQSNTAEGALLTSIRVWFRNTDPKAVAVLGDAATNTSNGNMAFRQAAAHALAAIHNSSALPFMALLLDDPDLSLRVEAVGGMGSFANGLAVQTQAGIPSLAHLQFPAVSAYKTPETVAHFALGRTISDNESSYVPFWKSWWSQNRAALGY
jgi:hypothetical protein